MKVAFQVFRSQGFSDTQVEPTAEKAAEFASTLRPDQLVSISHVMDGHIHIITVWFWQDGPVGV
jgi:hypothetical protein